MEMRQQQHQQLQINEVQTPISFVQLPGTGFNEGMTLSQAEQQYLLPHFSMGLIGKPGSGKSTMVKQMLMNDKMYKGKFDLILLVSPSGTKLGIPIPEKQMKERFDLDWIFKKIEQVNTQQCMRMFGETLEDKAFSRMTGPSKPAMVSDRFGGMSVIQKSDILGKFKLLKDSHSRFSMDNPFTINHSVDGGEEEQKKQSEKIKSKAKSDLYKQVEQMDQQRRKDTRFNMLIILDDVIGQIKKQENNPRLAQLFLNRRHLIYNGVISLMTITQKYTLIPSRIRSNMNWFIMYQLNPSDFKSVYEDVVIYDSKTWQAIVQKVFGNTTANQMMTTEGEDENDEQSKKSNQQDVMEYIKGKKFENLGIWVEFNIYFSNFKRLLF